MATQIDARDHAPGKAAASARRTSVATRSPAPAVGVDRTAEPRPAQDGPSLRELVGDWTWRHLDDEPLRPADADRESTATNAQFIRAFAWARVLIGY